MIAMVCKGDLNGRCGSGSVLVHALRHKAESVEVVGAGCIGSVVGDARFLYISKAFAGVPSPLSTSHRVRVRVFVLLVSPLLTHSCQRC